MIPTYIPNDLFYLSKVQISLDSAGGPYCRWNRTSSLPAVNIRRRSYEDKGNRRASPVQNSCSYYFDSEPARCKESVWLLPRGRTPLAKAQFSPALPYKQLPQVSNSVSTNAALDIGQARDSCQRENVFYPTAINLRSFLDNSLHHLHRNPRKILVISPSYYVGKACSSPEEPIMTVQGLRKFKK